MSFKMLPRRRLLASLALAAALPLLAACGRSGPLQRVKKTTQETREEKLKKEKLKKAGERDKKS